MMEQELYNQLKNGDLVIQLAVWTGDAGVTDIEVLNYEYFSHDHPEFSFIMDVSDMMIIFPTSEGTVTRTLARDKFTVRDAIKIFLNHEWESEVLDACGWVSPKKDVDIPAWAQKVVTVGNGNIVETQVNQ